MPRIPIGKLVLLAIVGYLAHEFYNLYLFCQPPLAEGDGPGGVSWELRDSAPVDLCVVLSVAQHASADSCSAAQAGGAESGFLHLGTFAGVSPTGLGGGGDAQDIVLENTSLPDAFFANRSVFLHVLALPKGGAQSAQPVLVEATRLSRQVVQSYRKVQRRFLLGGPMWGAVSHPIEDAVEAAVGDRPVASVPRVVEVGFVREQRRLAADGLRQQGMGGMVSGSHLRLPLFVNTLASPRDEYEPIVRGVALPSLEVRLRSVGLAYWTMQEQIGLAFDEAERTMGMNEYDADSFKQMVSGSSPWKLIIFYAVALLHLLFEFLAVSSDISFWREKTSFEGMSSTSIMLQACNNVIMFLYVKEQRQTKFVMYFIACRFLLQLYKLKKMTTFKRAPGFPGFRWVNLRGSAKGVAEIEALEQSERNDMRKLALVMFPLLVAFCGYRLVYHKFRSWYSWAVLSLAVCAQVGGFVIMTPQVFLNHRLKSVEHLPWRVLGYQAVNTFIDDVFMLCVRMPEVQKYSVFRDDIIFIICLVQRWVYKRGESSTSVEEKRKEE